MNTWKVSTHWGEKGDSLLSIFLNYGCIFFNSLDTEKIGHWWEARRGDLLLICDHSVPVAIAQMKTEFSYEEESDVKLYESIHRDIDGENVKIVICKAQFILFDKTAHQQPWGNMARMRFCRYEKYPDILRKTWDRLTEKESNGKFSIESRVYSLLPTIDNDAASPPLPLLSLYQYYQIPIYQRPYSWGECEIRRVFEDLKNSYFNDEEVTFMGTMQFSNAIQLSPIGDNNPKISYGVIDGQQRLTTFTIILCLLEKITGKSYDQSLEKRLITHVNRGSAQRDLEAFWAQLRECDYQEWEQFKTKWGVFGGSINPYLRNASCICGLLEEYFLSSVESDQMNPADVVDRAKQLYNYLENSLRFVVIETRAGLSKTLKIFNSINTAGLDLGVHDLFKLRLYEHRKNVGDGESIFDRISGIYEQVDEHNRQMGNKWWGHIHMWTVLEIYQRFLVVTHNMPRELYDVSMTRFFDRLFETILGTRKWEEFADYQNIQLDLADLERIVESLKTWSWEYITNEKLRIIHRFITQDTRYGNVWNYTVLALCFGAIKKEEMVDFHESLFKLLVPPSLCYAKRIYEVNSALLDVLRYMEQSQKGVQELHTLIEDGGLKGKAKEQFDAACNYELTAKTKWKNLVCRLVEYLKSDKKQSEDQMFNKPIDIEHIQCYTDKVDPVEVWETWKDELNKMGNLVILESSLNRSIGNDRNKKQAAYQNSGFVSVNKLANRVASWKLSDAEERKSIIKNLLWYYLSHKENDIANID